MRKLIMIPLIIGWCSLLSAGSPFSLQVQPTVQFPIGPKVDGTTNYYSLGGGIRLEGELNFDSLSFLHFGPQLEYDMFAIESDTSLLHWFTFGVNAGFKFNPFDRTVFRIWGNGGAAIASYDGISSLVPQFGGGADFSYRLTPSLNLGVGARYNVGLSSAGVIYEGVGVTIGIGYNFTPSGRGADLRIDPSTYDIYPLYYTWYDDNPVGEVLIVNPGREKISNVRASFYVPQYMEQPKLSEVEIGELESGKEYILPLNALFTNKIFEINEGLKVAAEVRLHYTYFGREVEESIPLTVSINNKNAMTWDDDRKAACFVTANNPLISSYSKSVSGRIRSASINSLDKNFQIGMGLFESLNLYNLGYVVDPSSSYADLSQNEAVVDYIQFPQQTVISQGGDCDDLSVLYASMLEASGIPSAFVTVPGHIYVAYELSVNEERAKKNFPRAEDLIFVDGKAWVPIEVTLVEDGFLYSWQVGARQIRENAGEFGFYPVREAWQTYPAAEFESSGVAYLPNPDDVRSQYERELKRFLRQEINPHIARLNEQIIARGETPLLVNRLGVTYARYGFLDEAEAMFRKALSKGDYPSSLINLGNINYLKNRPEEAADLFQRALSLKPGSEQAMVGLARVSSELEDFDTANRVLASLQSVNPDAAREMAHLGTDGAARASAAMNREVYEWDE